MSIIITGATVADVDTVDTLNSILTKLYEIISDSGVWEWHAQQYVQPDASVWLLSL